MMASNRVKNKKFWCMANSKGKVEQQRERTWYMWVEDDEGGEHSNFKSLGFRLKRKKKNMIRVGYLLFLFLLRRMAPPPSLRSFFQSSFLPSFFLFPKASFIILFPLLWAAGQYKIRKCSNSDPLFPIVQNPPPPLISETWGGGTRSFWRIFFF